MSQVAASTETLVVSIHDLPPRIDQIKGIVRFHSLTQSMDAAEHDPKVQLVRQRQDQLQFLPLLCPVKIV